MTGCRVFGPQACDAWKKEAEEAGERASAAGAECELAREQRDALEVQVQKLREERERLHAGPDPQALPAFSALEALSLSALYSLQKQLRARLEQVDKVSQEVREHWVGVEEATARVWTLVGPHCARGATLLEGARRGTSHWGGSKQELGPCPCQHFGGRCWPESLPDGFSELCTNQQMFQNGEVPGLPWLHPAGAQRTEWWWWGCPGELHKLRWPHTCGLSALSRPPALVWGPRAASPAHMPLEHRASVSSSKGATVRVKEPCPNQGWAGGHDVAFPAGRVPHAVGEMP